jgi:hypothetical protein
MAKDSPTSKSKKAERFAYLDKLHLGGIERRIAAGEYVDGAELAEALRKHGSRPIPSAVLDYLCRCLEGAINKPRGQKPWLKVDHQRYDMIVSGLYRRYLVHLTDRKRRYGAPAGWTKIEYTPAELAARLVARRFRQSELSWRAVQNIASSRK